MSTTDRLAENLARALQKNKPLTMKDREADPDMVRVVLNPGTFSSIGQRKFGPGDVILVSPAQAERLTAPTERRPYPAARYLDEAEPDARGNFPQVHGAGRFHPDSDNHTKPEDVPLEPAEGQRVVDGQLVEPADVSVASGPFPESNAIPVGPEESPAEAHVAASPPGRRKANVKAANADPIGDGGKTS